MQTAPATVINAITHKKPAAVSRVSPPRFLEEIRKIEMDVFVQTIHKRIPAAPLLSPEEQAVCNVATD